MGSFFPIIIGDVYRFFEVLDFGNGESERESERCQSSIARLLLTSLEINVEKISHGSTTPFDF